jgi:hypothetical protein
MATKLAPHSAHMSIMIAAAEVVICPVPAVVGPAVVVRAVVVPAVVAAPVVAAAAAVPALTATAAEPWRVLASGGGSSMFA